MLFKYKKIVIFYLIVLMVTISLKTIAVLTSFDIINVYLIEIIPIASIIGGLTYHPKEVNSYKSYLLFLAYIFIPIAIIECDLFFDLPLYIRLTNSLYLAILLVPKTIHTFVCLVFFRKINNFYKISYKISAFAIIIINIIVVVLGVLMIENVLVLAIVYGLFVCIEILSLWLNNKV